MIISPITCLIHFGLDYLFITNVGIDGVAYAAIITNILSGIVAWVYLTRYCNKKAKQNNKELIDETC